jgi:CHAT domain-containing protein
LLKDANATYDKVYKAIKNDRYHIVHFNGHAYFNKEKPHLSSLVLFDRDLTTGPILNFFGARPPALFFMNACETAASQSSGTTWEQRYDIFGLARAFLESGGYLVGSRWKVGDDGAAAFAKTFYTALIDGKPLGIAMRDARIACREASEEHDISWASYLFYGDPRLRFSPA